MLKHGLTFTLSELAQKQSAGLQHATNDDICGRILERVVVQLERLEMLELVELVGKQLEPIGGQVQVLHLFHVAETQREDTDLIVIGVECVQITHARKTFGHCRYFVVLHVQVRYARDFQVFG